MNTEERDQLIQRYYDGETIGSESALAQRLLDEDPDARMLLEGLRQLSDSIRIDIAEAVAEEDFSEYWTDIRTKLPKGPLTLETGEQARARARGMVAQASRPLEAKPRFSWRWVLAPLALGAALAVAVVVRPPATAPTPGAAALVAANHIDIEELDSAGPMVMVQQESDAVPAIVWFTETDATQEG
jgi:hypothetical protein